MTLSERCDLVLAAGRTLFVNGQATDHTVAAAERLGRALGIRAELMPRWGELELKGEDRDAEQYGRVAANPTGVIWIASLPRCRPSRMFRLASGLVQIAGSGSQATMELLGATVASGMRATMIILAMIFGLIVPKLVIDHFDDRPTDAKFMGAA
jgi:hypothetical protein